MLKTAIALIHAAEKENVANVWITTEVWANYRHATFLQDMKEPIIVQLTTI